MILGRLMSILGWIAIILLVTIPLALIDTWLEDTLHVNTRMLYSALVVIVIAFVYFHTMTKEDPND